MGDESLKNYVVSEAHFDMLVGKTLRKAVLVVARTVGQWCEYYSAHLELPDTEDERSETKEGQLPSNKSDRHLFLQKIVNWIFEISDRQEAPGELDEDFALFLGDRSVMENSRGEESAKFDHHDDTCCWMLRLTDKEFGELKQALGKNNLPEDLFVLLPRK